MGSIIFILVSLLVPNGHSSPWISARCEKKKRELSSTASSASHESCLAPLFGISGITLDAAQRASLEFLLSRWIDRDLWTTVCRHGRVVVQHPQVNAIQEDFSEACAVGEVRKPVISLNVRFPNNLSFASAATDALCLLVLARSEGQKWLQVMQKGLVQRVSAFPPLRKR
ncbi:hypothetical protein CDAR_41651 [Caerostris darwini]|uniref:Uncharacterized protein n=1 Tax=Caerostris darwini TaxID=1538125 RepID=A0AAV4NIC4_9ARAC|nr:hypothetical protein CDAR_41651 [Caerostris darwini]